MSVIDNRIVQMMFDNKQFESGVEQSTKSLNNLNKLLNNFGSVSTSMAGSAVEELAGKFNHLGIVGVTVIQNLVNKLTNDLTRALKSVSIDQLTEGFGKYEEKLTAVQTIMSATTDTWKKDANSITISNELLDAGIDQNLISPIKKLYKTYKSEGKVTNEQLKELGVSTKAWASALPILKDSLGYTGSQMEYVSEQLDRLNWFTDETSYSFTEMTSNIGKFTSQGQSLTDSVRAMEGIATWAAKSGQNSQAASRAMYNMSQALGVGSVKLMDWKSIENANMATVEFKKTAMDTAVELGKLTKKNGEYFTKAKKGQKAVKVTTENFSQTLNTAWFSSKVLMKTLDKYGGFATDIGDLTAKFSDQGITTSLLLKGIDKIYTTTANGEKKIDPNNSKFQAWIESTGVSASLLVPEIEKLAGKEYELGRSAFKAAQEAKTFSEALDATKDAASTAWMNLFEHIFGNYEEAKVLWTDLANNLYTLFVEPVYIIDDLLDELNAGEKIRGIINSVGDLADWFEEKVLANRKTIIETAVSIYTNVKWVLNTLKNTVKSFVDPIITAFKNIFPAKTGKEISNTIAKVSFYIQKFFRNIRLNEGATDSLRRTFEGVFAIFDILKEVVSAVIRVISDLSPKIADVNEGFLNGTAKIGDYIVKIRNSIKENDSFYNILKKIGEFVIPVFHKIFDIVGKVTNKFIEFYKTAKQSSFLDKITNAFTKLKEKLSSFKSILDIVKNAAKRAWEYIKGIYESVKEFISGIDFSKINFGDLLKTGIGAGAGIGAISLFKSLKDFIDNGGIGKGIINKLGDFVDGLNNVFTSFNKMLKSFANEKNSKALLQFSASLLIFAAALAAFTYVSQMEGLAEGLGLMVIAFGALVGGLKLLEKVSKTVGAVTSALLILSISMIILAGALAAFALVAKMDTFEKGMVAFAVTLGLVVGALAILGKVGPKVIIAAGAMMILSAAMIVLAAALAAFAAIAMMKTFEKGMIAFAVTLAIVVGALAILGAIGPKVLIAAAAMLILSAAMVVLAGALAAFAAIAMMDTFGTGLAAFAFVLLMVVGALAVLGAIGPMVIIGAAAMLILSAAMVVLAGALAAFAAIAMMDTFGIGLAVMAGMLLVLVAALVALGAVGPIVIVGAAALLIGAAAIAALGAAVIVCSLALPILAVGLKALFGAITNIATAIIDLIFDTIDRASETLVIIADSIGQAVDLLFEGISSGIEALGGGIGTAISLVGEGIASAIEEVFASVGEGIGRGLESIASGIEKIGDSVSNIGSGIGNVGTGIQQFGDGVRSLKGIEWVETATGISNILTPLKNLGKIDISEMQEGITAFSQALLSIVNSSNLMGEAGASSVKAFIEAFTSSSAISSLGIASKNLGKKAASMAYQYYEWYKAGSNSVSGFIAGVNSGITAASLVGTELANKLIEAAKETLKVKSPSRVFYEIGRYVDTGLANGVSDYADVATQSAVSMAMDSVGAVSEILANAIENDYANPVIRPTLDLSNVTAGASRISSMFGQTRIGVDGEVGGSGVASNGATYNFTQNNYSPKALNRIDIYRQTKNQISSVSSLVRG